MISQGSHNIEMWALLPEDEKEAWPQWSLSILQSIVDCVSCSAAIHYGTARQKLFYSHSPDAGHCCDIEGSFQCRYETAAEQRGAMAL